MEQVMTKKQRRVNIAGAEAYEQEAQVNKKMKMIGFEVGHCYYRTILKIYRNYITTEDGVQPDYKPGLPSHWMFQEMLGVEVKDPHLGNDRGFTIAPKYAIDNAYDYLAKAAAFRAPETEYDKAAYANFLRYLVGFSQSYKPEDEDDRPIIYLNSSLLINPTEEQKLDPGFDEDLFVLQKFQEMCSNPVPGTDKTGMEVAKLAAEKAIFKWSLANTDIKMLYTNTASASFSASEWYSGSVEPKCNDGGEQFNDVTALSALGRRMAQYNFDAEDGAGGADPSSKAYYTAFNNWLNTPKSNHKIMDGPNQNGVVFVVSSECVSDGTKYVLEQGAAEPTFAMGIMGWSTKKNEKIMAEKMSGMVYSDPDCCQVVLRFNVGSDKASAGKDMGVGSWSAPKKKVPYEKVMSLSNETLAPTIADRINHYRPLDIEGLKASFKKKYVSEGWDAKLSEEDKTKYSRGIELIMSKQTAEDVNAAINGIQATATVGGVQMIGGISLTDEPAPTPNPVVTPTAAPTPNPTVAPTINPTVNPTPNPTPSPTINPTVNPIPAVKPVMAAPTPTPGV